MIVAFRKRDGLELSESDLVREVDKGVIVVANAYDHGFATCWPNGSRMLLDAFEAAWRRSGRIDTAFAEASTAFVAKARELLGEPDDLGGGPGASLFVASIQEDHVQATWVGETWLVLFDGPDAVARSHPHTIGALMRSRGFDAREQPHRVVLTRVIREESAEPPSTETFRETHSRVVVLCGEADDPPFVEDRRKHADAALAAIQTKSFALAVVI